MSENNDGGVTLIIIIMFFIILCCGGVGYYYYKKDNKIFEKIISSITTPSSPTPTPTPSSPAPEPSPSSPSPSPSPRPLCEIMPEESNKCPSSPYKYCSTDTIEKIYVVDGCPASKRLLGKLMQEEKITGEDDPKVVKCCKRPDLCPGIRKYPSVSCKADPLLIYEGYCP